MSWERLSSLGPAMQRLCNLHACPHLQDMRTRDFRVFRERLVEVCNLRGTTPDRVARSIGMGARRTIDIEYSGLRALDIYRLAQIADKLDVSVDWLLGRTTVMEVAEEKKPRGASSASTFRRG